MLGRGGTPGSRRSLATGQRVSHGAGLPVHGPGQVAHLRAARRRRALRSPRRRLRAETPEATRRRPVAVLATSSGVTVCSGGEPAAGVPRGPVSGGWVRGDRRRTLPGAGTERVCVDLSPDFPEGATLGWRCRWALRTGARRCASASPIRAPTSSATCATPARRVSSVPCAPRVAACLRARPRIARSTPTAARDRPAASAPARGTRREGPRRLARDPALRPDRDRLRLDSPGRAACRMARRRGAARRDGRRRERHHRGARREARVDAAPGSPGGKSSGVSLVTARTGRRVVIDLDAVEAHPYVVEVAGFCPCSVEPASLTEGATVRRELVPKHRRATSAAPLRPRIRQRLRGRGIPELRSCVRRWLRLAPGRRPTADRDSRRGRAPRGAHLPGRGR